MAGIEKNDLTFYKGANELFYPAFALVPEYIFLFRRVVLLPYP